MVQKYTFPQLTSLSNASCTNTDTADTLATKGYVDTRPATGISSVALTNLNNNLTNAPAVGATSFTVSGDATAIFTNGVKIQIGKNSNNQILTVSNSTVSTGVTTVVFTPALQFAQTVGTPVYSVATTAVSSVEAGGNVSFNNVSGNLTISATGGGQAGFSNITPIVDDPSNNSIFRAAYDASNNPDSTSAIATLDTQTQASGRIVTLTSFTPTTAMVDNSIVAVQFTQNGITYVGSGTLNINAGPSYSVVGTTWYPTPPASATGAGTVFLLQYMAGSILSGTTAPVSTTGFNGQLYVNTTNNYLYWKDNAGTWQQLSGLTVGANSSNYFSPYQVPNRFRPATGEGQGAGIANPLKFETDSSFNPWNVTIFAGDRISVRNLDGSIIYWGNGWADGVAFPTAKAPQITNIAPDGFGFFNVSWTDGGDAAALNAIGYPTPNQLSVWKESGTRPAITYTPIRQTNFTQDFVVSNPSSGIAQLALDPVGSRPNIYSTIKPTLIAGTNVTFSDNDTAYTRTINVTPIAGTGWQIGIQANATITATQDAFTIPTLGYFKRDGTVGTFTLSVPAPASAWNPTTITAAIASNYLTQVNALADSCQVLSTTASGTHFEIITAAPATSPASTLTDATIQAAFNKSSSGTTSLTGIQYYSGDLVNFPYVRATAPQIATTSWQGNGITGSVSPIDIVLGSGLTGSASADEQTLTLSSTGTIQVQNYTRAATPIAGVTVGANVLADSYSVQTSSTPSAFSVDQIVFFGTAENLPHRITRVDTTGNMIYFEPHLSIAILGGASIYNGVSQNTAVTTLDLGIDQLVTINGTTATSNPITSYYSGLASYPLTGNFASGVNSVTVVGNATADLPNTKGFTFSNQGTAYQVTGTSFASGNTTVSFTPALVTALTSSQTLGTPVDYHYSSITTSGNLTAQVQNKRLTLGVNVPQATTTANTIGSFTQVTTLADVSFVGDVTILVASTTGMATGQWVRFGTDTFSYRIKTVVSAGAFAIDTPLRKEFASGANVSTNSTPNVLGNITAIQTNDEFIANVVNGVLQLELNDVNVPPLTNVLNSGNTADNTINLGAVGGNILSIGGNVTGQSPYLSSNASTDNNAGLRLETKGGGELSYRPTGSVAGLLFSPFANSVVVTTDTTNTGANVNLVLSASGTGRVQATQAPVSANDLVRLTDLQASQSGLKPQNPTGTTVHISQVALPNAPAYVNNTGVSTATLTASVNGALSIAGVVVLVNDIVLVAGQSAQLQNGSYTVVVAGNATTPYQLRRTAVVPAYGNFWLATATGATNYGAQFVCVTQAPITIGTTSIIYDQFGLPNNATPTLDQVTIAGNLSTNNINIIPTGGNGLLLAGGASTNPASITATGNDASINLALAGKSSGTVLLASQRSNFVTVNGGDVGVGASIFASGVDTNITLNVRGKGSGALNLNPAQANYIQVLSGATGINPILQSTGSDTNINLVLTGKGTGTVNLGTSQSSYIQIVGAASGFRPAVRAEGADTNIPLIVRGKGTSPVILATNLTNAVTVTPGDTGVAPIISSLGGDANVDLIINATGTGVLRSTTSWVLQPASGTSLTLGGGTTGNNATLTSSGGLAVSSTVLNITCNTATAQLINSTGIWRMDGQLQARSGIALNSNTTASPAYSSPLSIANQYNSPSSISDGAVGQMLVSRGSGLTPAWSNAVRTALALGGTQDWPVIPGGESNQDFYLGTISKGTITQAFTAALQCANALNNPTFFTAGNAGQVLVSRGAGQSPAWVGGSSTTNNISTFTLTGSALTGAASINLAAQTNQLGLTVTNEQLSGWVAGGVYKIDASFQVQQNAGTADTSNCYMSLTTNATVVTSVAYGSGVGCGGMKQAVPNTDFTSFYATGVYTATAGGILYSWKFTSSANGYNLRGTYTITRLA